VRAKPLSRWNTCPKPPDSYRVERTRCFMNSDIAEPIFEQQGSQRIILNEVYYQQILKEADS